jgi:hypothetical protein
MVMECDLEAELAPLAWRNAHNKNHSTFFDAMADHTTLAMRTAWGQRLDRTFKAVECPYFSVLGLTHSDIESLVIRVAALIALGHVVLPWI